MQPPNQAQRSLETCLTLRRWRRGAGREAATVEGTKTSTEWEREGVKVVFIFVIALKFHYTNITNII